MYLLLTILLSFYPTIFIYTSVPSVWMKRVDAIAPSGMGFFLAHLAVFGVIFFVVHMVFRRFVSLGYRGSRFGIIGIVLMTIFVAALALVSFYLILPGNIVYAAPTLANDYVLKNPYTVIALVAPWIYLFFD